ncbi:unnamed protein product [Scytosiphon promiscuus]
MRLIASQKEVPPDMEQAVCTIIWAADRAEVAELSTVKSQFAKKYGQEYVRLADLNEDGCVNPKVVEKLDCQPPSSFVVTEYLLGIAEEFNVEYTPAVPVNRKTSADVEAAAAAAASGPQPAYEAPGSRRQSMGHGGGAGGGGAPPPSGGGGGISSPPPVTAWAVPPSDGLPLATATISPQHSFSGGGGGGGGAGWNPAAPQDDAGHYAPGETVKGHYGGPDGSGGQRRGSGGYEEAVRGWGPSDAGREEGGGSAYDEKKMEAEDAPPPYSPPRNRNYDPNDIPSAPSDRPMTYDIPAAPGYEDKPKKSDEGGDGDDAPAPSGGDGGGGAGTEFDDLAARFMNLRK